MKYLLILLILFSNILADDKKQKITLGLGPFIQTQAYKGVDTKVLASPVIFYDNGILYVRWTRVGLYFLGEKQDRYAWGFSLTVLPRVNGYDSNDIEGMQERESSWEGGLAFSASMDKTYIEILALSDILARHDSWVLRGELGYEFELGDFSFYPSVVLVYQSSSFINYYYGTKNTEALKEDFDIAVQTYIEYPLTDKLSTLINIRVDKLSTQATQSPLVDKDFIFSGLASLIYTFEY